MTVHLLFKPASVRFYFFFFLSCCLSINLSLDAQKLTGCIYTLIFFSVWIFINYSDDRKSLPRNELSRFPLSRYMSHRKFSMYPHRFDSIKPRSFQCYYELKWKWGNLQHCSFHVQTHTRIYIECRKHSS